MPFIGRYTRYPIYPQFGGDPTLFQNVLGVLFETDLLNPGGVVEHQLKTAGKEIRLYDMDIEILDSAIDFTLTEGATCVDGVTVVPVGNADRNSTFVSSVYASLDPTAIVGGLPVTIGEHFGLPSPLLGLGNVPPQNVQYLTLKFNTNYIFRIENVGTNPIIDLRVICLFSE